MRNFLRALRFCWPYRYRLVLSIFCALFAAVLWGLPFTAIYPVLKILGTEQNLQDWVDSRIGEIEQRIEGPEGLVKKVEALGQQDNALDGLPDGAFKERSRRDLAAAQAKASHDLDMARWELYRYLLLKKFVAFLPKDRFQTLLWVIGLVVVSVGIKGIFEFSQEMLVGSVVNLSLFDMRNRFYRHVLHLDVNSFSDQGTSEVMARFTNDMEMLGNGQKTLFGKVIAEPLRALACIAIAAWISWQLTLMFLILVPFAAFILTKVGRLMKRATRRLLERMSSIYKILQESLQAIRVVKAFTMEPYERRRFHEATKDYYRKAMMVVNLEAAASPIIELLGIAAVAGALLVGAYLVVSRHTHLFGLRMTMQPLDGETLLQLYALLAAIADPVRKLSSVYTRLQSGAAAADRVFHLADRMPRVRANSDGVRLDRHHQAIEFRDVCFSYRPGEPILTNISLTVRAGETIALVGSNGCGKTTLLGLVPRFFDVDHGSIVIDSHDVRHIHLRTLRKQIGIVTQEATLFDDTVYNNIAYGNKRAAREEVEAAARQAYAHDFIMSWEHGYETRIGEMGGRLSGGQKQRIALARAILRNPAILILDEFTSAADPESEAVIHRALKEFVRNRTTFIITHRLNTLEIADRILVLDAGRVAAVGTHQELITTCPTYQRLHEAQFRRLVA